MSLCSASSTEGGGGRQDIQLTLARGTPTGFWSGIFKDGYPSKVLDVDARMKMKYILKERD